MKASGEIDGIENIPTGHALGSTLGDKEFEYFLSGGCVNEFLVDGLCFVEFFAKVFVVVLVLFFGFVFLLVFVFIAIATAIGSLFVFRDVQLGE